MRKGELTRQKIVELSAPVFNRKGFAGAAISDLMEATGLEKGGIYRHFETKQELAENAFDYAWKIAIDNRFAGSDEIPNTVDRLKQIVRNFMDRRGLVAGGCPLLNTAVETDDGNPRLRAKARRALDELLGRVRQIICEGQRRGEIRCDIDAQELATLMASMLEGSVMIARLQRSDAPRELACRHLENYLEVRVRTAADAS
jgi:TetR/AcrR family transcriptional regulator, transcriptional repressor for nem operon